MADEIKCPVCGKVGIPDYHVEDTVCPQCGSDLSIFRVIDQIPQGDVKKKNVWMPIAAVAILTAAVLGDILSFQAHKVSVVEDQSREIAGLQDSIKTLNSKLETTIGSISDAQSRSEGFKYVVRSGDNLWAICSRFYGDTKCLNRLAEWNNIDDIQNHMLHPGDTIIIKQ